MHVSWIEGSKILISQLSPRKFRHFSDQNGPKGDTMKVTFDNFEMQKWVSYTVKALKAEEKMGSLVYCFHISFLSYGPKIIKNCPFCNFLLMLAKNLRPLKQFMDMYLKVLVSLFSKMILVIMPLLKSLQYIVWSWWILLNFCCASYFLIFYSFISCELLLGLR